MDDIVDIFTLSGVTVNEQLVGEALHELESFLLPRNPKQQQVNNKRKENILLCFQVSLCINKTYLI